MRFSFASCWFPFTRESYQTVINHINECEPAFLGAISIPVGCFILNELKYYKFQLMSFVIQILQAQCTNWLNKLVATKQKQTIKIASNVSVSNTQSMVRESHWFIFPPWVGRSFNGKAWFTLKHSLYQRHHNACVKNCPLIWKQSSFLFFFFLPSVANFRSQFAASKL